MESDDPHPKTALVLCGGGSRGALEVGLYRALVDLSIRVDLVVGSSIGAVNGAFIAAGVSPGELAGLWNSLNPREFYRVNRQLLWKLFRADSLYDNRGLGAFLRSHLPATRFEDLQLPFIVTGTELQTGETVYWTSGDLIGPLLASTAIPGIFPPVVDQRRQIVDGGISNNAPIDVAVHHGAERVIIMLCIGCEQVPFPVKGLVSAINYALSIAVMRKIRSDIEHYRDRIRLVVMEPRTDFNVSLLDFRHSEKLIEFGYQCALGILDKELDASRQAR